MDPRQSTKDFLAMLTHLCEAAPQPSHPGWPALQEHLRLRVETLLNHPDSRYVPDFKCMDLLTGCANIARSIAFEPQLRPQEALGLLKSLLADDAEAIRRFRLEAALERARYEPMMLHTQEINSLSNQRHVILHKRWHAMRSAQQAIYAIAEHYMAEVDYAVTQAIGSADFQDYRIGPLMQLFAEMLHTARLANYQGLSADALAEQLHPTGRLWRSYALKSRRFRKQPKSNFQHDLFTSAAMPNTVH